ncbi:hypothetical protein WR25_01058 [Diploscapter pachys]|uniref:Endonuclease/exonuclease/phosphatase domain-containing protein n=1 Tax=Diploscapter pachys TaxID=2018661 RepID=A0A2A2JSX2_9BILA|nr:hypothetical protein WR25_01058 [Diploscapter pachys]
MPDVPQIRRAFVESPPVAPSQPVSAVTPSLSPFEKWPLPASSVLPASGAYFVETVYMNAEMYVPKRMLLAWNIHEKPKKDAPDQSIQTSQCFLFSVYSTDKPLVITLRRPIDEHHSETVQKSNLLDCLIETQQVEVNGEPFGVSIHPPHISSFVCQLKPFVGCPYVASVDIVAQDKSAANFNIHWFVKDEPSSSQIANDVATAQMGKKKAFRKEGATEDLRIRLNEDKAFSIVGCSYRATGEIFTPSSEDEGKKVVALIEMGENAIAKCHEAKHPISRLDEPYLSECQLKWCRENGKPENGYRVVLYNLLADLYLNLALPQDKLFYPYCKPEFQQYEYRYPHLLRLLAGAGASRNFSSTSTGIHICSGFDGDLMFLSEVDHRMQLRYLPPLCTHLGLEAIFQKKGEQVSEGSLIAYKKELFECISKEGYLLSKLAAQEEENRDLRELLATGEETSKVFTTRPTVLQTVVLRVRKTGDILLCATIHLHHAPQHEHVKTLQSLVAVRQIEKVEKSLKLEFADRPVHVLFGGDLNSEPDGPVYELLKTGFVGKSDQYWALDPQFQPTDLTIPHPLDHISDCFETTNFTRYKNADGKQCGYSGCIDYVWGKGIKKLAVCPMPSMVEMQKFTALPSKVSPSDHLPIICHIALDKP